MGWFYRERRQEMMEAESIPLCRISHAVSSWNRMPGKRTESVGMREKELALPHPISQSIPCHLNAYFKKRVEGKRKEGGQTHLHLIEI